MWKLLKLTSSGTSGATHDHMWTEEPSVQRVRWSFRQMLPSDVFPVCSQTFEHAARPRTSGHFVQFACLLLKLKSKL